MNKTVLNIRSVFFVCLYLWYICLVQTSFAFGSSKITQDKGSKEYVTSILAKESFRFTHFQLSENQGNPISEQSFLPFKHLFVDASEESRYSLGFIQTKIRKYLYFSANIYRFTTSDIIYPFHYYW